MFYLSYLGYGIELNAENLQIGLEKILLPLTYITLNGHKRHLFHLNSHFQHFYDNCYPLWIEISLEIVPYLFLVKTDAEISTYDIGATKSLLQRILPWNLTHLFNELTTQILR